MPSSRRARASSPARRTGCRASCARPIGQGTSTSTSRPITTTSCQVRWDTAAWSGAELDWTSAGELVVQFPSGIARIDLETGGFAARRCGWGFGLSDQLFGSGRTGPSICDME